MCEPRTSNAAAQWAARRESLATSSPLPQPIQRPHLWHTCNGVTADKVSARMVTLANPLSDHPLFHRLRCFLSSFSCYEGLSWAHLT